jgi:excisionase family DNA binding protein
MFAFTPEFYNELASRLAEPLLKRLEAASKASKAVIDTEPPLTTKEAAKWLKCCEKTVLAKINSGQLRASNNGTLERPKYLLLKSDLLKYFNDYSNRK